MSTDSSDEGLGFAIAKFREKESQKQLCRAFAALMVNLHQGYNDIQEMDVPVFLGLLNVVKEMEKQAKRKAK